MSNMYTQYSVELTNVSADFLCFLLREEQLNAVYEEVPVLVEGFNYDYAVDDNTHDFGEWEISLDKVSGEITVYLYAEEWEPNMAAVNRVIQKYILHETEPTADDKIEYVSVSYGSRAQPEYQGATVYVVDANDVRQIHSYQVANLLSEGKI